MGDERLSRPRHSATEAILQVLTCLLILHFVASGVSAALQVSGGVVDENGAPVEGAWVELHRLLPRYERRREILQGLINPESESRVRTSQDGGYTLAVPESGMWQVKVRARGKIPVRRQLVPLLESEVLPQAVLTPDAGLEVLVASADGRPLEGAQVWFRPLLDDLEDYRRRRRGWEERGRFGLTDENGRASLSRRAGDATEVFAYAYGFMESKAVRTRGPSASVDLERGRPLTVRFLDPSAKPAARSVSLVGDRQWTSAMIGDEGLLQVYLRPDEPLAFGLITTAGQIETGNLQASLEDLSKESDEHEEMTLPRPTVLEGRVIGADGREGVAGSWVWAASDPGNAGRSDAAGNYRLVQGTGWRWRIAAAKPGYMIAWDQARMDADSLYVPTLALVRSAVIEGRVVDSEGEGVEGAQVQVLATRRSVSPRRESPRTSTDHHGQFRLFGIAQTEALEILIEAEGFARMSRVVRPEEVKWIEVTLSAGRTLTGRLVSSTGEPVAGAQVTAVPMAIDMMWVQFYSRPDDSLGVATSDVEGRFRLDNTPDQPLGLVVEKTGFAEIHVPVPDVEEADQLTNLGDLILTPGLDLEGVVKNKEGEAVVGARVEVQRNPPSVGSLAMTDWSDQGQDSITTDIDGRFLVNDLASGESVSITVQHPGFITYRSQIILADSSDPTEIVLESAARVSGRVENERGEGVEGVYVTVILGSPASGRLSGGFSHRITRERVRSGEDGHFTLVEVPPGRIELSARGAGHIAAEKVELVLVAGQEKSGVVLRIQPGVHLSGTVTDPSGRPVSGASLMVTQERKSYLYSTMFRPSHSRSDADGQYLIEGLDPETEDLVIRVSHSDHPPLERPLDLTQGSNRLDVVLEASSLVAGFVFDQEGEPVSGAKVGLEEGEGHSYSSRDTTLSTVDGSFEIAGVAAGVYRLFAVKEGFARSAAADLVEVTADRDIRGLSVYLSRGGTIRGQILGLEPDELAQVQVMAADRSGQYTLGFVAQNGEYRVPNVGFSEGTVQATMMGRGQAVSESFDLDPVGGETRIDLEFSTDGSVLEGVVLFDGEPWGGVRVLAQGGPESQGFAVTDGMGRFQVHGLNDGSHELSLVGTGAISHTETIQVLGSTEVTIEITGVRISGTVVDSTTWEGIQGASVAMRNDQQLPGFPLAQVMTLQSGRFEVVLPANRSVTLQARAEGFTQGSVSLDTGSGDEIAGIELALDPASELELEVRLASGLRPRSVSVAVVDHAGGVVFSDLLFGNSEGSLRLRSIPAGEWLLIVAADGGATASVPISVPGSPVFMTLPIEARINVDLSFLAEDLQTGRLRLLSSSGEPFRTVVGAQVLSEWPVAGPLAILPFVPAGDWIVELVDTSGQVWRQQVTTVEGQTTQVSIR